jgi:hypothetical protein
MADTWEAQIDIKGPAWNVPASRITEFKDLKW